MKNQLRHTVLWFNADKLADKQKKYGADLQVVGTNGQPEPAAEARSVPTLGKNELPKLKEPKKRIRTDAGSGQNNAKPVINITTGMYYSSAKLAALAIGVNSSGISQRLTGQRQQQPIAGNMFRFATSEELKSEKYIPLLSDSPVAPVKAKADRPAGRIYRTPVVCITTKQFFASSSEAATALGVSSGYLSERLSKVKRMIKPRPSKYDLRFATPDEIQAKRYIP